MELHQLSRGEKLREVYHLGFDGEYLQFFVKFCDWLRVIEILKDFSPQRNLQFVHPTKDDQSWGFESCSHISYPLDGSVAINIPVLPVNLDCENMHNKVRVFGYTVEVLTRVLSQVLYEEEYYEDGAQQLFHVSTYVGKSYHGGGFDLTVSLKARQFLQKLGEGVRLSEAICSMTDNYYSVYDDDEDYRFPPDIVVRLRDRGLLHMNTVGNCACLGTSPDSFKDNEGCCLVSHNVDTVLQQFNLLIGIASIWQLVRRG